MGLFAKIADVLYQYESSRVETAEEFNAGIREVLSHTEIKPDRFQRDSAAYRAETEAYIASQGNAQPVYAQVGGVTVDLTSDEYAAWWDQHFGYHD